MKKKIYLFAIIVLTIILNAQFVFSGFEREIINMNETGWKFIRQDVTDAEKLSFDDSGWLEISIPHDWNGGIDGVHDDIFTGPNMYKGIG